jgi:hypothetical protein
VMSLFQNLVQRIKVEFGHSVGRGSGAIPDGGYFGQPPYRPVRNQLRK